MGREGWGRTECKPRTYLQWKANRPFTVASHPHREGDGSEPVTSLHPQGLRGTSPGPSAAAQNHSQHSCGFTRNFTSLGDSKQNSSCEILFTSVLDRRITGGPGRNRPKMEAIFNLRNNQKFVQDLFNGRQHFSGYMTENASYGFNTELKCNYIRKMKKREKRV